MAELYPTWGKLRRRSPANVTAEIKAARARLPAIGAVVIRDDTFLANPTSYVAEFSRLYKAEVGLPFQAYTTAQTADRTKFQYLVDAGLRLPIMGVQTGSARIQELYQRRTSNEQMLRAARLIHSFVSVTGFSPCRTDDGVWRGRAEQPRKTRSSN
jgi:anaerobic magnesium-protoporphyrin IX monomethyl ester cyclase